MRIRLPGNGLKGGKNPFLSDWVSSQDSGFPGRVPRAGFACTHSAGVLPASQLEGRETARPTGKSARLLFSAKANSLAQGGFAPWVTRGAPPRFCGVSRCFV